MSVGGLCELYNYMGAKMDYHEKIEKHNSVDWKFYNFRSTKFIFELYPDNDEHQSVIDYVNLFALADNFQYRYILHDKDKKDDGTPLKPHYHLYLEYIDRIMASKVCKIVGLDDKRWIMECDSKSLFLRYLIHYDNPEKYLYSIDEVHTCIEHFSELPLWRKPRKTKKDKYISKELRGEDGFIECLNLVDNICAIKGQKGVSFNMIIRTLCDNGLYNHLCGHRDLIYRYYEGIKYNR